MPGVAAVQIGGMLGSQSITRDDASCISTLPTGQRPAWVIQQLREAFGFEIVSRHLVFDRDPIFSAQVVATLKSFGIEPTRTACRSPWQNGVAERWIGSVRREMLDHVVVFNERHLRRLLRDYVAYYHDERTHLAGQEDASQAAATRAAKSARLGRGASATRRAAPSIRSRSITAPSTWLLTGFGRTNIGEAQLAADADKMAKYHTARAKELQGK